MWYVLVFGLVLAAFSVFVYLVLSQSLYVRLDRSLSQATEVVAGEFRSEVAEHGGNASFGAAQTLAELHLPGIFVAIFDDRELLAANFDANTFSAPELLGSNPRGDQTSFQTVQGYGKDGARVAVSSAQAGDKAYLIAIAEPLHHLFEQLESIRRILLVGFPASLLIAGIGGFFLAKKSLAPVVALSNQAERISARNLHDRLSIRNKSDELGHLARVFNELLSRLDGSFESMREFIADASHELRTPLSIIRGEADVALSQDREPTEYRDALMIIQDEAKRLSRVVDDMMALARADAGQRQLQIEEFYLNDLIEECCRAATVLTVREGVLLTMKPTGDISFRGDEDLLRRMLLNLLDNAIKYTPSGGSVSVELARGSVDVKIIVSDTGIGIPADQAAHVFERFYRVDQARSRADGGTGLGLAIAKWVAEAHKGSIRLESSSGHGSTFTVSLPG
jgi:heavy metal sensor kinase